MSFTINNGVLERYSGDGGNIVIPEGVTKIDFSTFAGCGHIDSVEFPKSLKIISSWAFQGCVGLYEVTIPDNVCEIQGGTFYGCSNLQTVRMPQKLLTDNLFSPSSKMITLELTDAGKVINTVPAVFRKDYPSAPQWIRSEDYIVPIGSENIAYFDNLMAAGAYDGFSANEDGRVKAILWRLNDKAAPISADVLPAIRDFMSSKLTKAIKYAVSENAEENIKNLISVGIISSENEKKASKALQKSEDEAVKSLASRLGELISACGTAQEEPKDFPLAEKFEKAYKKASAREKMLKYNIEIPELKAADGNGVVPKEYLELFIAMYSSKAEIIPLADEAAQMIDRAFMNEILLRNYEKQATNKNKLALVNAVMRFADEDTVRMIYRTLADKYNMDNVLHAVILNDSKAAMLIADKNKCLGLYAWVHDMDVDVIRDTVLVDFGLDYNGSKQYDLGSTTVVVTLKNDLTLELFDTGKNKIVKSIPKKGNDEALVAAAAADFSELKKNVKKVAKNRSDRLFSDFLYGTENNGKKWKDCYFANPLLRHVAELIVWQQGNVTFVLKGTSAIKADGASYEVTDAPICVAHPIEMKPEEVEAWQKYFVSNGLKQPFAQIWERAIDPSSVTENRYEGCTVPINFFRGAEKHGLSFYDENFHSEVGFTVDIPGCRLDGERTVWHRHELLPDETFTLGKFSFDSYTRCVNHLVTVLDRWTVFDRIKKDDVSIEPLLGSFTLAQIAEFIRAASENNAVNVTALLLDYKNKNFSDFDPMEEFSLNF